MWDISIFFVRWMLATLFFVELKHSIKLTPGSVVPMAMVCIKSQISNESLLQNAKKFFLKNQTQIYICTFLSLSEVSWRRNDLKSVILQNINFEENSVSLFNAWLSNVSRQNQNYVACCIIVVIEYRFLMLQIHYSISIEVHITQTFDTV